ncbi:MULTISPECIES: signal peptidase I [Microbacterium]|jgi:signal peptidase|uniref:signal peptidase I n=1 Tax=Microbacterium TaxID=33882 RepID=UPI001D170BB3|nr:signal peptidase I [Microbacterium testaceum]MCC4247396.1 signal peptidase I [Microbacterium testaceum]
MGVRGHLVIEPLTASRPFAAHAASSSGRHPARSPEDRPLPLIERVRDAVTMAFGCLGILVVAWFAASALGSLGIIVFVTGSMAPSLPTGAAAITRVVDASELSVGDVVTVRRPDGNVQVTHRIVDIAPVGENPRARSLTLRGDANTAADLEPYVVTEAARVLVGAPAIGWLIIGAKTPAVMLGGAVLVAFVVAWALWPMPDRVNAGAYEPDDEPDRAR